MAKPKADRKAKVKPEAKKPKAKPRAKAESTGAPKAKRGAPKGSSPKTANAEARALIRAQHAEQQQADSTEPVYDTLIARIILERLSDGETLNSICLTPGMPKPRTVRRWALDPAHEFAPLYSRARELGYHSMADEIVDIMDDGRNDWMERRGDDGEPTGWHINGEHVQRSRLRVEGRKWLLSKALPKIYGDKVALTDADGGKLVIEFAQ